MDIINRLTGLVSGVNKATLSGALDVVAVQDEDGVINCTPFHVRFGKLRVFRSSDKSVAIKVNGVPIDLEMKLGDAGEGYFIVPRHTLADFDDGLESGDETVDTSLILSPPNDDDSGPASERMDPLVLGSSATPAGEGLDHRVASLHSAPARVSAASAPSGASETGGDTDGEGDADAGIDTSPRGVSEGAGAGAGAGAGSGGGGGASAREGAGTGGGVADDESAGAGRAGRDSGAAGGGSGVDIGSPDRPDNWEWGWGQLPVRRASEVDLAELDDESSSHAGKRKLRKARRRRKHRHKRGKHGSSAATTSTSQADANADVKPGKHGSSAATVAASRADTRVDVAPAPAAIGVAAAPSPVEGRVVRPSFGSSTGFATANEGSDDDVVINMSSFMDTASGMASDAVVTTVLASPAPPVLKGALPVRSWFHERGSPRSSSATGSSKGPAHVRRSSAQQGTPTAAQALRRPLVPRRQRSRSMDVRIADVPMVGAGLGLESLPTPRVTAQRDSGQDLAAGSVIENTTAAAVEQATARVEAAQRPDALQVDMSLCGEATRAFDDCIVSARQYAEDPTPILSNPALIFRVIGHTSLLPHHEPDDFTPGGVPVRYLTLAQAAPVLVSLALFPGLRNDSSDGTPPAAEREAGGTPTPTGESVDGHADADASLSPQRRGAASDVNSPVREANAAADAIEPPRSASRSWFGWLRGRSEEPAPPPMPSSPQSLPPQSPLFKARPRGESAVSLRSMESDAESTATFDRSQFRRSLRPTPEQLQSMGLKPGANELEFEVVSGGVQGATTVSCNLFLWSSNAKIVISDVDGTITKSDVLGHLMYMVGRDWTHEGVARLFTNIKANGYQMLYLTSRAIGQTRQTRTYLQNIEQGDMQLPHGPIITSPDRLFTAFKREVIDRRPETFKIQALRDVQNLFPMETNPFYAGFGNRPTDVMAYKSVGIADGKIFIINPTGEVRQIKGNLGYVTSYPAINSLVHTMFPSVCDASIEAPGTGSRYGAPVLTDERFNEANFWRVERPIIMSDDEDDA